MRNRRIHHTISALHSSLAEFYYHKLFYQFGFALISIFIPIYFITIGFSLINVFLWLLLYRFSEPLLVFVDKKIANRIGMCKTFIVSLLLAPVSFVMIWQAGAYPGIFFLSALLWGFMNSLYWSQELTLFIEISKSKSAGIERGGMSSLQSIFASFAPFIGGLLLVSFGMYWLIVITSVILLVSVMPIIFIKDAGFKLTSPLIHRARLKSINRKTIIELLHRGFQGEAVDTFLPLFIFLFGLKITEVGIAGSLLAIAGVISPIIIGKAVDKKMEMTLIVSVIVGILGWLFFVLYPESIVLFIATIILGVVYEGYWLTTCKRVCLVAKRRSPSYFGIMFELLDDLGRGIAVLFLFVLFYIDGVNSMIFGVIAMAVVYLIWKAVLYKKDVTFSD